MTNSVQKSENLSSLADSDQVLVNILQNIVAFYEFVFEAKSLVVAARRGIRKEETLSVRMALHTIKGNASAFGLDSLVTIIQQIENNCDFNSASIQMIGDELYAFLSENREVLEVALELSGSAVANRVELDEFLAEKAQTEESDHENLSKVAQVVESLQWTSVSSLVGPLKHYCSQLAYLRGKEANLSIEGGDLMIQGNQFKPLFRNLVHLIRNGIDHGIELPGHRGLKPRSGELRLQFYFADDSMFIKYTDDGAGINEAKVLDRALEKGRVSFDEVRSFSEQDRLNLIFMDGVSTADLHSEISGLGIGMCSLNEAASVLGGEVSVKNKLGIGIEISIQLPLSVATPE